MGGAWSQRAFSARETRASTYTYSCSSPVNLVISNGLYLASLREYMWGHNANGMGVKDGCQI